MLSRGFEKHERVTDRAKKGFSLTEMLVTLAILVLVGMLVAAGIPTAGRVLTATMDTANSQITLTHAASTLRSNLSMAVDPVLAGDKAPSGTLVSYTDSRTGFTVELFNDLNLTHGYIPGLCMRETLDEAARQGTSNSLPADGQVTELVSQTASQGARARFHVEVDSIEYDGDTGIFSVHGLAIKKDDGTEPANSRIDLLEVPALAAS